MLRNTFVLFTRLFCYVNSDATSKYTMGCATVSHGVTAGDNCVAPVVLIITVIYGKNYVE